MCITTVCLLNPTELACSQHKQLRNDFNASVAEALGPAATIYDFDYNEYTDLTPDLDYYDDFDYDCARGSPDKYPYRPATSEVNDQYLNVDLMLPRRSGKSRGRVTKRAQDNAGNLMVHANPHPIIDSK